jgi:hypothetical protein
LESLGKVTLADAVINHIRQCLFLPVCDLDSDITIEFNNHRFILARSSSEKQNVIVMQRRVFSLFANKKMKEVYLRHVFTPSSSCAKYA